MTPDDMHVERTKARGSARGAHSGLAVSTLRAYAKSPMLEFGEGDMFPLYLHSLRCPNYCEYACNGNHGFAIADDIRELQLYKSPNAPTTKGQP